MRIEAQAKAGELLQEMAEGLLRHAYASEAEVDAAFASAVERYPFLRDVPAHPPARLLELADTLDAAADGERAAMEDQVRGGATPSGR